MLKYQISFSINFLNKKMDRETPMTSSIQIKHIQTYHIQLMSMFICLSHGFLHPFFFLRKIFK